MLREFIKPKLWKILPGVFLGIFALVIIFSMFIISIPYYMMNILKFIGLPFMSIPTFNLSQFWVIPLFLLEFIWLYLLGCMSYIVITKAKEIKWTKTTYSTVASVIIVIIFIVLYSKLGWSDMFIPTADDSGATSLGISELAISNNRFAIDLYREINKDNDENIFFSPWSISTAMAMVYEGANGNTAEELQEVFHFPTDAQSRRASYARMLNTLNKASGKYKLSTANAVWLQEDYPFLDEFKNTIKDYYLGEVINYNLAGDPTGASAKINSWVSKNTNGKIDKIVEPSMFHPLTRAVLANAIYFKGKWVDQFDKDDTRDEDFTLESGQTIKVPMMRLRDNDLDFNYVETDGVQILELPYQGDKVSMLLLLPRTTEPLDMDYYRANDPEISEGQFEPTTLADLEAMLSPEKLSEWRSKLNSQTVFIHLPKYKFETSYSLVDYLKDLGVELAFMDDGSADFSLMDGTRMLYIEKVLHKAYIDVNEEGTEAAAATVVMIATMGIPHNIEFRADHPFVFLIQENETGNILFMGKVMDPSK